MQKFNYKVILNGRRALNGKQFSMTLTGYFESENEFFGNISDLLLHVEEEAAKSGLNIADGIQLTVEPKLCASASLR